MPKALNTAAVRGMITWRDAGLARRAADGHRSGTAERGDDGVVGRGSSASRACGDAGRR